MTIEELEAHGAPRWILEGPNSGGVSGVYYWGAVVYFFHEEIGASGLDGELPVERYLNDNASTNDVRVRAAIDAIEKLVGMATPILVRP
jgi:hypothetical protein